MRLGRLWLVLGLIAVVVAILLGYRMRVMVAGGRAVLLLAVVGVLVWLALHKRRREG
jgi:hypothetical protein